MFVRLPLRAPSWRCSRAVCPASRRQHRRVQSPQSKIGIKQWQRRWFKIGGRGDLGERLNPDFLRYYVGEVRGPPWKDESTRLKGTLHLWGYKAQLVEENNAKGRMFELYAAHARLVRV